MKNTINGTNEETISNDCDGTSENFQKPEGDIPLKRRCDYRHSIYRITCTICYCYVWFGVGVLLNIGGITINYLAYHLDVSFSVVGYSLIFRGVGSIIGSVFIGKLCDFLVFKGETKKQKGYHFTVHLLLVICLFLGAVAFTLIPFSNVYFIWGLNLLVGVTWCGGNTCNLFNLKLLWGEKANIFINLCLTFVGVGGGLFSLVYGYLVDLNLDVGTNLKFAYFVAATVILTATFPLLFLKSPILKTTSKDEPTGRAAAVPDDEPKPKEDEESNPEEDSKSEEEEERGGTEKEEVESTIPGATKKKKIFTRQSVLEFIFFLFLGIVTFCVASSFSFMSTIASYLKLKNLASESVSSVIFSLSFWIMSLARVCGIFIAMLVPAPIVVSLSLFLGVLLFFINCFPAVNTQLWYYYIITPGTGWIVGLGFANVHSIPESLGVKSSAFQISILVLGNSISSFTPSLLLLLFENVHIELNLYGMLAIYLGGFLLLLAVIGIGICVFKPDVLKKLVNRNSK